MKPDAAAPPDSRAVRLRRELRALAAGGATPQELAIHLAAAGYDPERSAALLDQLAADDPDSTAGADPEPPSASPDAPFGPALRVWAPFERARFSPDAWGQLLRLRADGMGEAEFEHLVDRALLQLDGPVGTAELRSLLGDTPESAAPPTIH